MLQFLTLFRRKMHFKNRNSLYIAENKTIAENLKHYPPSQNKLIILNKDKIILLDLPRSDFFNIQCLLSNLNKKNNYINKIL